MEVKSLSLTRLSSLFLAILLATSAVQAADVQPAAADDNGRRPSISVIGQPSVIDPQHLPTVEDLEDSLRAYIEEGSRVKEFEDFLDWMQGLVRQNNAETTQSSYAPILQKIRAHIEAIQKEGSYEYFEHQYYLLKKDESTTNKYETLNMEIGRILEQADLANSEKKCFEDLQKLVIAQIKSLHKNKEALKKEANEKHKASHSKAGPDFTAADKAIRTIQTIRAIRAGTLADGTTRVPQASTVAATAVLKMAKPGTSGKLANMVFDPLSKAADSVANSQTLKRASLEAEVAECIRLKQADKFDTLLEAVRKAKREELGASVAPSIDQATRYNKLEQDLLTAKESAQNPERADSVTEDKNPASEDVSEKVSPGSPVIPRTPPSTPKESSPAGTLNEKSATTDKAASSDQAPVDLSHVKGPEIEEPAATQQAQVNAPAVDKQPSKPSFITSWTRPVMRFVKNHKILVTCVSLTAATLVGYRYGNNITKYLKKLPMIRAGR